MAARPTISQNSFHGLLDFSATDSWRKLRGAWAGGKQIGEVVEEPKESGSNVEEKEEIRDEEWDLGVDDFRGWLIAFTWILASAIEYVTQYQYQVEGS